MSRYRLAFENDLHGWILSRFILNRRIRQNESCCTSTRNCFRLPTDWKRRDAGNFDALRLGNL
jgi:hypothetical protein